jgi:hypothetical protein
MNAAASNSFADVDTLRAQYRELSLVENDVKRDLAWAQENLNGIRELKKEIQQQIFGAAGEMPALPGNAVTTTYNGPTN